MTYEIERIEELSLIEKIVISNVFEIIKHIAQVKTTALTALRDDDFIRAKAYLEESEYFEHTPVFLKKMQKNVLEYCSVAVLKKIINNESFKHGLYSTVIIPIDVLPKLSSFDKYKKDEKWEIYKALGATIVV